MCNLEYNGVELTLKQAITQAKSIRKNSIIGRALTGSQLYLMSELLKLHYRLEGSESRGLLKITVEKGEAYQATSFCAHYVDGGHEYFGVSNLALSQSQRQKRAFHNAARTEVLTQTRGFLKAAINDESIICAITGEVIPQGQATVDHYPIGFKTLMDEWLQINGLDWREIKVKKHHTLYIFESRKLAKSWQDYHRQNAQFRIAQNLANRRQGNPSKELCTL